jgi:hypothetical protein
MRTIKDCRAGDTICDKGGNKARVLGRLNSLIFRSEFYRHTIAAHHFLTVEEAEEQGWKLLSKDGREPMSKKEVERLLGNVKIL